MTLQEWVVQRHYFEGVEPSEEEILRFLTEYLDKLEEWAAKSAKLHRVLETKCKVWSDKATYSREDIVELLELAEGLPM